MIDIDNLEHNIMFPVWRTDPNTGHSNEYNTEKNQLTLTQAQIATAQQVRRIADILEPLAKSIQTEQIMDQLNKMLIGEAKLQVETWRPEA